MPFVEGDIIYGEYTDISDSGSSAVGGPCYMYIESISTDDPMVAYAKLFDILGEGENIEEHREKVSTNNPPINGMDIAQRGNMYPDENKDRLTSFFVDTETANLYMLDNVSSPNILYNNYGTVIGRLPESLYNELLKEGFDYVSDTDPIVYSKFGIFQNLIQFDHQGNPIQKARDRGAWDESIAKGSLDGKYKNQIDLYDTVTYEGQMYRCMSNNTESVPGTDNDWLLIVAKGDSGASSIYFYSDPTIMNVAIDKDDYITETSKNNTYTFSVYARTTKNILDPKEYSIELSSESIGSYTFTELESKDNKRRFNIKIKDIAEKINKSALKDFIKILFIKEGEEIGELNIPVFFNASEWESRQGKPGAYLYPAGRLELGRPYVGLIKKDSEGNITAKPVLFYQNSTESKGNYYVLLKDIENGEDNNIENLNPSKGYWEQFTEFQYLMADFLMANWAKFGSNEGAIFYDKYLFSQKGHGNTHYSEYEVANGDIPPMFENGELSGSFIPKLHLDFYNGLANLSCLCEPYNKQSPEHGVIQMSMENGFNLKVPFPENYSTNSIEAMMPIVVLPSLPDWARNGSHVTILFESGGREYGNFINGTGDFPAILKSIFLLVCVDNPYDKDYGITYPSTSWDNEDYIIYKGKRSKYIILSPGNSVKLKAANVGDNVYWYIDNEGSITEEKVDIYSITDSLVTSLNNENLVVTPKNAIRTRFYGADYSTLANLKQDYHGEASDTRGLMLYSGIEGFCPRNIVFSKYANTGYRLIASTKISTDFAKNGPILGD